MLIHGDCTEVLKNYPEDSFDLVFADPPYNIRKADWDNIKGYHAWNEQWINACSRVLKPNGAFWVSHSVPEELILISKLIPLPMINWITWDKWNGGLADHNNRSETWGAFWKMVNNPGLRCFAAASEYLIYHADEGPWNSQCDNERGFIFEPIRSYLEEEMRKAGVSGDDCDKACGLSYPRGTASRHYFSRSQWCLPTEPHFRALQELFAPHLSRDYEELRKEYEELRESFRHLRYTFNNPGRMSSVWPIPPAACSWHPTPKPKELLRRIILATTNPGDAILEPFGGSCPAAIVAYETGRECVSIEKDNRYFDLAKRRIHAETAQMLLFKDA